MSTVTLSASARYGYGGKQFVARITGRHPKFTFAYEFMGRKEGKRGESTSVTVDDPGLYITRDVDSKGRADDSYALVYAKADGLLAYVWIGKERAMKLAKAIESGAVDWSAEGAQVARIAAANAREKEITAWAARASDMRRAAEQNSDAVHTCHYATGGLIEGQQYNVVTLAEAYEAEAARLRGDDPPPIDRVALEAERAKLAARIAEIDALTGGAS